MYPEVLFIHSWTRWIVLVALFVFSVRCLVGWARGSVWTARDHRFASAVEQAYGFQALFGVTLWLALSPIVHAFFLNRSLLSDPTVRFWSVRHPAEMIFAFVMYASCFRFASRSARPFRSHALLASVVFFLVVVAVPWPFAAVPRPLFRFPW